MFFHLHWQHWQWQYYSIQSNPTCKLPEVLNQCTKWNWEKINFTIRAFVFLLWHVSGTGYWGLKALHTHTDVCFWLVLLIRPTPRFREGRARLEITWGYMLSVHLNSVAGALSTHRVEAGNLPWTGRQSIIGCHSISYSKTHGCAPFACALILKCYQDETP